MAIKLIIFDLDGTLVDSLADLATATNRMLATIGKPLLSEAEVRQLVGQGARRLVERALPEAKAAEVDRGLELFLAYNDAHIADHTSLYPGVKETLATLIARGLALALVSNKNEALCRKLLGVLGIDSFFAAVLGADSLPFRKPSPEPVLRLLRDFHLDAVEAVMVGDSINDIAAGQGAGVVTVGCTFGYGDVDELADADYRIDSLPGLLRLPLFD